MPKLAARVLLTSEERLELEGIVDSPDVSERVKMRARIVLNSASGMSNTAIARKLGVSRPSAVTWRRVFLAGTRDRVGALLPRHRSPDELAVTIATAAMTSRHLLAPVWTIKIMAEAQQVSRSSVQRAFSRYGVRPDLYAVDIESLVLDGDPQFADRISGIAGLFYSSLTRMLALEVRIRPCYLTQPADAVKAAGAACNELVGTLKQLETYVIGGLEPADSHLIQFLNAMHSRVTSDNELHLLYWHDRPAGLSERMRGWRAEHPRFKLHFTPNPLQGHCWTNFLQSLLTKAAAGRAFSGRDNAADMSRVVKQWQATHLCTEPVGNAILIR